MTTPRGVRLRWAAVAVVALCLPFWIGPSNLTTAVIVAIAAIGATGLNVVTGFAGQISLGHAFFGAVGAYTFVQLSSEGAQNLAWVLVAGLVAGAAGFLVGPLALRLQGLYLAVVTLGLVFIGQHLLFNIPSISGGPEGRPFPPLVIGSLDLAVDSLNLGPIVIDAQGVYYYVAVLILAAGTAFTHNLSRSRTGRAMFAVRDREDVATAVGVSVPRVKVLAFTISAVFGGLSGALYVSFVGYAQPSHWDLLLSIQFVAAIIVGGLGTTVGPTLGAFVVFAFPTVLRDMLEKSGAAETFPAGAVAALVYGLLIVAFLAVEPLGLVGLGRRAAARLRAVLPQMKKPASHLNTKELTQ